MSPVCGFELSPRPSLPAGFELSLRPSPPAGRGRFRVRVCLRAGTSDRCAPAVLSLPPLRGGPLTVHEATGGYAVRSPCPSGIPRPRHNASPLGLEGLPCFDLLAALILKFGLEIENRCKVCPCFDLFAASIRKSGPEIGNRCSAIVPASRMARLQQSLPPRCCVRFQFSSSQSRTLPPAAPSFRQVERSAYSSRCRYDAASDSIFFRCRKVERFRLQRHRAGK